MPERTATWQSRVDLFVYCHVNRRRDLPLSVHNLRETPAPSARTVFVVSAVRDDGYSEVMMEPVCAFDVKPEQPVALSTVLHRSMDRTLVFTERFHVHHRAVSKDHSA